MTRTAAFDAAVKSAFTVVDNRLELVTPDGRVKYVFQVVDGTITEARSNGCLTAQATFTAVDRTDELGIDETTTVRSAIYGKDGDTYGSLGVYGIYSQTIQSGVLMPYGSEVKVYCGLRVAGGAVERVLVGTFQLNDMSWDGNRTISMATQDLSLLISNNAYTFKPFNAPLNTNYGVAIEGLLRDSLTPGWNTRVTTDFSATSELTPLLAFGTSPGGNRWADLAGMARVILMQIYVDRNGRTVHMQPTPDPKTSPAAWTIEDGPGGTLVDITRSIPKSKTYNGVVVTGEGTGAGEDVRGEAFDEDPLSPTYYQGDFGYKPLMVSTPLVKSAGMAQNLANFLFVALLGMYEELTVSFVPNPALQITDVVHVRCDRLGVDYNYVIDRLTIPLKADGLMTATLRRRKEDGEY